MQKGDLKKQAILDTAEKLFFEKGYQQTSIQDILDRLHCSKGSFYHHYESKLQVLMEICRSKAAESYAAYLAASYGDGLEALNGLVYHAMPFRKDAEGLLTVLLPLQGLTDGQLLVISMVDALKEIFFPEMEKLLKMLKGTKTIHYHQELLPELLWDCFTACFGKLLREGYAILQGAGPQNLIAIMEAERFMWERLTDAPFGSMELMRADEILQTMNHAIFRIKRMEYEEK